MRSSHHVAPTLLIAATALGVLTRPMTVQAGPIGPDDFGPGAIVESFEGLLPGPNSPQLLGVGFLKPGVIGPFTFGSGVILTGPVPNIGVGEERRNAEGILVGDFSIGPMIFGLGQNGLIDPLDLVPPDGRPHGGVPDGSAFLSLNAHPGPIELSFTTDMLRVGALMAGGPGVVTLSTFDGFGNLLETVSVPKANVLDWDNTFIGLESIAGIRRITFSDSDAPSRINTTVLDKITFEPVPEPTSLLLLGTGLAVVIRKCGNRASARGRRYSSSYDRPAVQQRSSPSSAELESTP